MSYSFSASSSAGGASTVASDLLSLVQSQSSSGQVTNSIAADLLAFVGNSSSSSNANVEWLSQIEQSILRSANPIEVNESEELTVLGQRGLWLNRAEVNAWRGDISIEEYRIHQDSNPQIITKRVEQVLEYVQELAIRYLRPPTPPAPGEILITQEPDYKTGPAPPLIIRQAAARAETPEPLVVREAPPQPPMPVGPKRITISGKLFLIYLRKIRRLCLILGKKDIFKETFFKTFFLSLVGPLYYIK